ncbi:cell division protein FtsI [Ideonella oryzae]|uniref:Cell division protein FtsI n=1 Tax=Ideonella oryzae TaxID=2937441 RepID=A0ABT1BHZ4_9BURK|nr:cell division protein FtsI [Ideonella oryzae]
MRVPLWSSAILLLPMTLLQSGCSVFSAEPLWELAKAGGALVQGAVTEVGPSRARDTMVYTHGPIQRLCVEYNRSSQAADLLPALVAELQAQHIESRVYEAGGRYDQCDVWLRYTASIQWAVPPTGSDYRPYLDRATLVLNGADGRVLATSSFVLDDGLMSMGRWASTRDKLAPAVKALIGPPPPKAG